MLQKNGEEKVRSNVLRITPKKEEKPVAVDREKTCPLLLRVFTSKGKKNGSRL
jgi:16S rRNA A1518/A1519 N6-dimethyltransferase RsmA/KsgA/DIM1 with predicted DNA glycosylase/AP lyase activity